MQSKLEAAESRATRAERVAELAEADAEEKDRELIETLNSVKRYQAVSLRLSCTFGANQRLYRQIRLSESTYPRAKILDVVRLNRLCDRGVISVLLGSYKPSVCFSPCLIAS